jgi:membrane peptidoglycan carboxypeptidase
MLFRSTLRSALSKFHYDMKTICAVRLPVGRDDLSELEVLVVLLEDRRFFQHQGIDWKSIIREFWKMCTYRRHGGASTIDMQLVRTVTGYRTRTFRRKGYEMLLSYALQKHMNKIEILRAYLHIAYFGTGIVGSKAAAETLYDKELLELSRYEAAQIASMLVYPKPGIPTRPWRKKIKRRSTYGLRLFEKFGSRYMQRC